MKKINRLSIVVLLCICMMHAQAATRKVLFIGNSYTAVNNLPTMLKDLALSMGDTLIIDSNTPGGMTFNGHTTNATTLAKIAQPGWDYVVLQAQSQEPSFSPSQVATDTYPYAKTLDSLIHVANPCAETLFYMTWGRKNGDASNCAFYPPVCTYEGMQQRLRESYLEMSQLNQATCVPAGVAWKQCRTSHPGIELYSPDESHPSLHGSYLVAVTFYASIFHKSCIGATFMPVGIGHADAVDMQTTGSKIVLDSLENWQVHGNLPFSKFDYNNTGNQYVFANQSLRSTSYNWDFGDGSAFSTLTNPTHTYTAAGTYVVTLTAKNACGKSSVSFDTIVVSSVPNNIIEANNPELPILDLQGHFIRVKNAAINDQLIITNTHGQIIWKGIMSATDNNYVLPPNSTGLCFYQIVRKGKPLTQGKLLIR